MLVSSFSSLSFTGRARYVIGDRKQNAGLGTTRTRTAQLMMSIGVVMIRRTSNLQVISLSGRLFPGWFWGDSNRQDNKVAQLPS